MQQLFSEEGGKRLDGIDWQRLLCAFDFDGTLAAIVPQPGRACLAPSMRERLVAIRVHAPLAIITGRSVADIRQRLGFAPDFVVGNHGLEGVPGWEAQADRHRALSAGWMGQLAALLQAEQADPGIFLENKDYSMSVHYRMTRNPEQAEHLLQSLFMKLSPQPRVVSGKMVFNLLGEDACNKGSALVRLMQITGARNALYAGDDVTDEDVFRLRHSGILSIRVERHPDSAADFFLERQDHMARLLDALAARLRAAQARNWVQCELDRA
jgi:trehalose 6-phosphate phosphatase